MAKRPLGAAVVVLLALLAAGSVSARPDGSAGRLEFFRTPSGNIGCVSDGTFLRCDIRSGLKPKPRRPSWCDLDWGRGLNLSRTGRPKILCAGDTAIDPGSRALGYGKTWRRNGFTCVSRTSGLTCTNAAGHGLFLSRQSWSKF